MKEIKIDINCDVGEGLGNETELLPFISSCNIACGGHAGDEASMLQITKLAKKYNVLVGAHPSYPDKDNFGRLSINIEPNMLIESIRSQIKSLLNILNIAKVPMHHIKPHGALYNDVVKSRKLALIFLDAIKEYKNTVVLYAPSKSAVAKEAMMQGFSVVYEAFADRNYNNDLNLVSRKMPNAVLNDPKEVLDILVKMVKEHRLKTIGGRMLDIEASTYCLHGDNPNALQILTYLSKELPKQNILIKR